MTAHFKLRAYFERSLRIFKVIILFCLWTSKVQAVEPSTWDSLKAEANVLGEKASESLNRALRPVINDIDRAHTAWVDSTIKAHKKDICGKEYADIGSNGFQVIKKQAEKLTDRCYSLSNLPQGIGINHSNYQNLSEEIFFDSLLQNKMDHIACRKASLDCLNRPGISAALSTDFVDRLGAFKIYRDHFKKMDSKKGEAKDFTEDEKKLLSKYFPGDFKNPKAFFSQWDPITAINLIVNYNSPGTEKGFLFQEAFASLAQEEKTLDAFGSLSRNKQLAAIQKLINNTSESQKKVIDDDKAYWDRACRLLNNPSLAKTIVFIDLPTSKKENYSVNIH